MLSNQEASGTLHRSIQRFMEEMTLSMIISESYFENPEVQKTHHEITHLS